MITFITVIHIATVVLLVIAVLLQSGKGAEISATFGGSSQTVFGSSGGANFFQKLTYGLAAVFMVTSLTLTILPSKTKKSVFENYTPSTDTSSVPANGAPAAAVPATAPATGTETAKNETAAQKTDNVPAAGDKAKTETKTDTKK
jgi:preprotein translocase subunit SecG